jgi:hypothetical protein
MRRYIDLSVTVDDTTPSAVHQHAPGDHAPPARRRPLVRGANREITIDDLGRGGADDVKPGDIVPAPFYKSAGSRARRRASLRGSTEPCGAAR